MWIHTASQWPARSASKLELLRQKFRAKAEACGLTEIFE